MSVFNLPDLGEGLPDAQIREWYVKVGDTVVADQPLVAMETAKALVDVPSPQAGIIEQLLGAVGDTIETGQPLIAFKSDAAQPSTTSITAATVAVDSSAAGIIQDQAATNLTVQAAPAVRALAKRLGVDLSTLVQHANGKPITAAQVEAAAAGGGAAEPARQTLTGLRKAMVLSMTQSHQVVTPVTLNDDVDLHAWSMPQDITLRLIRAIEAAVVQVPIMNAAFDGATFSFQLNASLNLGLAVDTPQGLYVPVLKNVAAATDQALREQINQFKQQAQAGEMRQADLHGATLILSNFGSIAGRYANPVIVPPMVAIVGVGRASEQVVAHQGQVAIHRLLPLSLTVDHRLVTGGEAARFLRVMMDSLAKATLDQ